MTFKLYDIAHGILLGYVYRSDFLSFALRNLIPHLDTEGYFEERPLSTRAVVQSYETDKTKFWEA
jgi:hypothetical protein